eukprot:jgi/Psemu1/26583/gm1.26583_g
MSSSHEVFFDETYGRTRRIRWTDVICERFRVRRATAATGAANDSNSNSAIQDGNNSNSNTGRSSPINSTSTFATIQQAQDSMQDILDRLVEINENAITAHKIVPITVKALAQRGDFAWDWDPPVLGDYDKGNNNNNNNNNNAGNGNGNGVESWGQRAAIFRETNDYFQVLVRTVQEGRLSPSRKHGKELSQLVECVLYVCGQQDPCSRTSSRSRNQTSDSDSDLDLNVPGFVGSVLRVLEVDWNLDVGHRHYDRAIAACCNVGDWHLASRLFEKQIDPNAGGPPVSLSIENPLGLYALAMRCRDEEEERARSHHVNNNNNNNNGEVNNHQDDNHDEPPPPPPLPSPPDPYTHTHTHTHTSMVAEHVMDAVQRLVMVSPSDQAGYVLAAGNALGHAGAWRELEDYRLSTVLSKDYGRPLVAACLRACCLAGDYAAGLALLKKEEILSVALARSAAGNENNNNNNNNNSGNNLEEEWQWGGARDLMDPLCRDLAMQVIGGVSIANHSGTDRYDTAGVYNGDDDGGFEDDRCYDSRLALELFRQSREEGVTISKEALLGVVEACERDKDWRGALSVLRILVEEEEMERRNRNASSDHRHRQLAPWVVPGSWLRIVERDQLGATNHGTQTRLEGGEHDRDSFLPELGTVLASVMRNCNHSSNFGMSLFALQLFRLQHHHLQIIPTRDGVSDVASEDQSPEDGIVQMLFELRTTHPNPTDQEREILTASMVALCGLRCPQNAMQLYEIMTMTTNRQEGQVARDDQHADDSASAAAAVVYQYASMNHKRSGTAVLGNPWTSAHRHIDRLLTAGQLVRKLGREIHDEKSSQGGAGNGNGNGILAGQRRNQIEEMLARAMNSCTNAHQPELALYMLEWMEDCVFSQQQQQQQQQRPPFAYTRQAPADPLHAAGLYGDSVTAEIILARRWIRDFHGANELFEGVMEKHAEDDLDQWRKTISAGLIAMVANGRGNDAVQVFEILDRNARSTDCYTTIGRHLSKIKDWKELIDLYRDATEEGYSSEELSMLALMAVTQTKVDNRLRILRAIVDDCAASVGLDSKRWTMTKYWSLKRLLGFYHARLLMWWNDEQRAPLDEVNLAIKEYYKEKANGMRPKNDIVRAIVSGASRYDSFGLETTKGYEKVPRSEDDWVALLEEVLHTMKDSFIRYDPTFVDSVVQAYKSLGRSRECVDYVSEVINVDETRMRQSTLEDVLEAAEIEHADELYNDIQMLLVQGTNRM